MSLPLVKSYFADDMPQCVYNEYTEFHMNHIFEGTSVDIACKFYSRFHVVAEAKLGNLEKVKNLIETHDIDLTTLDKQYDWLRKDNAFFVACAYGHIQIVKYLRSLGVNIFLRVHDLTTPLIAAVGEGHIDIVIFLIGNGYDSSTGWINEPGNHGGTPFLFACQRVERDGCNYLEIIKCLADNGCSINIPDNDGTTPLMMATLRGSRHIVRYLLALEGIDVNAKANDGYSSLDWTYMRPWPKITKLLLQHPRIEKSSPHLLPILGCCRCHKVLPKMHKCGRCKAAPYCSSECQRNDWPVHKVGCKLMNPN